MAEVVLSHGGMKLHLLGGAPVVPGRWHTLPVAGPGLPGAGCGARAWLAPGSERRCAALDKHGPCSCCSVFNQICTASGHSWGKKRFPSVIRGKFGCQGAQILIMKLSFPVDYEFLRILSTNGACTMLFSNSMRGLVNGGGIFRFQGLVTQVLVLWLHCSAEEN